MMKYKDNIGNQKERKTKPMTWIVCSKCNRLIWFGEPSFRSKSNGKDMCVDCYEEYCLYVAGSGAY